MFRKMEGFDTTVIDIIAYQVMTSTIGVKKEMARHLNFMLDRHKYM